MDPVSILVIVVVGAVAYLAWSSMSSNNDNGNYQANTSGEVVMASPESKERMIARRYASQNAARFDEKRQMAKAAAQASAQAAQSVQPAADDLVAVDLLPKNGNKENWHERFAKAENMTLQENFVSGNQEAFLTNELPARKFMNQDLRKSPVVPTIAGLTLWNQHTVHPSAIAQDQTRPSLDAED